MGSPRTYPDHRPALFAHLRRLVAERGDKEIREALAAADMSDDHAKHTAALRMPYAPRKATVLRMAKGLGIPYEELITPAAPPEPEKTVPADPVEPVQSNGTAEHSHPPPGPGETPDNAYAVTGPMMVIAELDGEWVALISHDDLRTKTLPQIASILLAVDIGRDVLKAAATRLTKGTEKSAWVSIPRTATRAPGEVTL
jgi:hypothetical protein